VGCHCLEIATTLFPREPTIRNILKVILESPVSFSFLPAEGLLGIIQEKVHPPSKNLFPPPGHSEEACRLSLKPLTELLRFLAVSVKVDPAAGG
jgi:hypothetical protein